MLLDNIIDKLVNDDSKSLNEALLNTKVLLYEIGKKELTNWVNRELNGYEGKDELPSYRFVEARVLGNIVNVAWRVRRQQLPIAHLPEDEQKSLTRLRMGQSLAVLEELLAKGEAIGRPLVPELYALELLPVWMTLS